MMKQHYQAYVQATHTAPKTRQVVMLYDGVIRFLQQAKEAIQEKRIEDRYHLVTKATEIIYGLQGALDFENGGRVAQILYNYYSAIDLRLFSIHHNNSAETCDELIADLRQMRDVWAEIDRNAAGKSVDSPSLHMDATSNSGASNASGQAHSA